MTEKLALVTGVSGFIGGNVAFAFLEAGFRVRGTVRSKKYQTFVDSVNIPGLEIIELDDLVNGDLSEALKGVDVLLHVASPPPGSASSDEVLSAAVDGTLNILKQATAAKIKKIIITSSSAAVISPDMRECFQDLVLNESNWGSVTPEEIKSKSNNPLFIYMASKLLAEQAVWKFAREHPHVDITTVLPTLVFGPFAPGFPLPSSPTSISTNSFIHTLMTGKIPHPMAPWCVDVRDVAKAHLKAALLPSLPTGQDPQQRRFFVSAWSYTWKDAISNLNKRRPEVETAKLEDVPELPGVPATLDTSRVRQVLGITDWITPERMVEDAIDSIREAKKTWTV